MFSLKKLQMTNQSYINKVVEFLKSPYMIYFNSLKKNILHIQKFASIIEKNRILQ